MAQISDYYTSEDLCVEIVEMLNAVANPVIAFRAVLPDEVPSIDASYDNATVFVYPLEEAEVPIDRADTMQVEMTPNVMLFSPLADGDRGTFLAWCKQLRQALRNTTLGTDYGKKFDYRGSTTLSLYDTDTLKSQRMIAATFRPSFVGCE